ncbi:RNA methyltransferase [Stetteria hydrogenophila]
MFRVRLVLVGVEGEVNLGYIARLADNFDVDELVLVKPSASVEGALRFAAKAKARLEGALVASTLREALEGASLSACTSAVAREDDVARVPADPRELASIALAAGGTVAVVFGRESTGLTREEIAECDLLVTIPASEGYPTLNLSNAVAIVLYELFRARRLREAPPRRMAGRGRVELLLRYASQLASSAGDPVRAWQAVEALRRILYRAVATEVEVERLAYLLSRAARRVAGRG